MSLLRRIALFASSFLLRLTLFFGFSLLALTLLFSNGDVAKNALSNVNAYDRFISSVLESGKQKASSNPADIPFDDPQIEAIIKSSFDKNTLSAATEQAIDSGFAWLKGETQTINYKIDLTQNKEKLARNLSDYAINRLGNQPACTDIPESRNIFTLACQPIFIDLEAQRQVIYQTIMNDKTFIAKPVITAADLPKVEGKPFTEAYADAPNYYQLFMLAPWILFAISAALGAVLIYGSRTKRQGVKKIATSLVGTGVVLMISPLISGYITPTVNDSVQKGFGNDMESAAAIFNDFGNALYGDLNRMLITIAIQVFAVGIIMLIVLRFTKDTAGVYEEVEARAGLTTSINKPPSTAVGIKPEAIPLQTSELPHKNRKAIKTKKKYPKL